VASITRSRAGRRHPVWPQCAANRGTSFSLCGPAWEGVSLPVKRPNILPHRNLHNPILRETILFLRMSGKDNRPLPIRIPQNRYQSVHRASDVFFSFEQYWPRTHVPVTAERTEPHSQSIPSLASRVLLRQTLHRPITPTLEPHFEQVIMAASRFSEWHSMKPPN
jgi:hypothetical protein